VIAASGELVTNRSARSHRLSPATGTTLLAEDVIEVHCRGAYPIAAAPPAGMRRARTGAGDRRSPFSGRCARRERRDREAAIAAKTVEVYVAGLPASHAQIVERVRAIFKSAAPTASESIKWAQPVYEQDGPFAYIKAFPKAVNIGFWRGADLPDPDGTFQGDGDRMRHIKVRSVDELDEERLAAWTKEAVRLNRSRGDPTKRS
jgi:hypothetical protein